MNSKPFNSDSSGPEYGEAEDDNGGHEPYHASFSTKEYKQILLNNSFKALIHKIRNTEC